MKYLAMLAGCVVLSASASADFFDNFNRADGPLGANYTTITGSPSIVGNEVTGANGNGLTVVNSSVFTGNYDQTIVQADIRVTDTAATLTYCAVSLGSDATTTSGHGIFVKFQRQVAGGFSHIGAYTGAGTNNTGAISLTGGNFQALGANTFSAGRMTVRTTSATGLYIGVDTDFNGSDEFNYTGTLNFPTLVVGNQVGLHVYGNTGRLDNFRATVVPEPATMAALGIGVVALIRRRRK